MSLTHTHTYICLIFSELILNLLKVVVVPKQVEYFQDAQSDQFTAPPESLPETIPGFDADGGQPQYLEPEVGDSVAVVVPLAEDQRAEKLALERENFLKHGGTQKPAKQDAMQDWKSSDLEQGLQHAEELCQELHEEQIMQLLSMEKFKDAASCTGETATIVVKKLSEETRVEFFTMVEDMVMANRKKVSILLAASKPVKAGPPTAVPKPAAQTAMVEPAKVPQTESAVNPKAPLPTAAPLQKNSEAAPAAPVQKTCEAPAPEVAPGQKNSNADLAMLAELKPSGPAAGSVAMQPAPDRTLEMNGLQALMAAQKGREQQRLSLAQTAALTPATEKLDWGTHKKEGMRLKRLLEEISRKATSILI